MVNRQNSKWARTAVLTRKHNSQRQRRGYLISFLVFQETLVQIAYSVIRPNISRFQTLMKYSHRSFPPAHPRSIMATLFSMLAFPLSSFESGFLLQTILAWSLSCAFARRGETPWGNTDSKSNRGWYFDPKENKHFISFPHIPVKPTDKFIATSKFDVNRAPRFCNLKVIFNRYSE